MMRASNVMNSRHHPSDSLDYFPTPPWATRAVLHELIIPTFSMKWFQLSDLIALDPCAGGGHMAAPLREVFEQVEISDVFDWGINPPIRDFTFETIDTLAADGRARPDWIFCNPPFKIAQVFLDRALAIASMGCAFFVRTGWLSGQERYDLVYGPNPPTFVVHFAERVSLIEKAWDPECRGATDYVWLIWIAGMAPQPPVWLRPGMEEKYTRAADMALASPGEAKRRLDEKKKRQQEEADRRAAEQAVA